MITHTNESSSSEDEEMSTSDGGNSDTEANVLPPMPAMELTQIEFEAYPPADEDWDGVRALLDGLVKGLTLDVGNFSQTLIDNYKVTSVAPLPPIIIVFHLNDLLKLVSSFSL